MQTAGVPLRQKLPELLVDLPCCAVNGLGRSRLNTGIRAES